MANILTADLPSDDDLDDDFDPSKDDGGSGGEKKRPSAHTKRLRLGRPLGADALGRDEHEEVCSLHSVYMLGDMFFLVVCFRCPSLKEDLPASLVLLLFTPVCHGAQHCCGLLRSCLL